MLFVVSYYSPYHSGVTEYVKRLAEGLAARGHYVEVLTSQHARDLPLEETVNGIKIKRLPVLFKVSKGVFKPALLPTLRRMSSGFDVINIHVPLPEVGLCTLVSKNRNIILTYHCDLELHNGLTEKIIEKIYYISLNIALPRAKRIIVNDLDYARQSEIRDYKSKIVEIYPPITTYKQTDPTEFKRKYCLEEDDVIIGFLGRLVYEKGLEYLVKAVPLVLTRIANARFIIAGEGEEVAGGKKHSVKNALKEMSKQFSDRIIFTGFLPKEDIAGFYSACDVFVLPSIATLESFGMVQVEAMLCGTPVVSTDMPGVKKALSKTKMGLTIQPRNEKAIADAIIEVAANKGRYVSNRSEILKYFGTDRTVDRYEKLFGGMLKNH